MQKTLIDDGWDRWRLRALGLAAILIVVVPSLTLRKLSSEVDKASDWVTHTQAVGTAVYRLQANVRDAESAAYTLSRGIDTPEVRDRYSRGDQIQPVLRELEQLLQDNPRQLVRIGRIASVLERRMQLVHGVATTRDPIAQRELLQEMTVRYPIRELIEELQAEEEALLEERSRTAERQQRLANMVSWTALALQLSLLVLTLWLLKRQMEHRLAAERASDKSSARANAILQTVREPIVLLDKDQRILLYNPAFADLYGIEEDVLQHPLQEVGEGIWNDPAMRQRLADVLLRGRELWDYELAQEGGDGRVRNMLVNARRMALPDSDDEVVLMTVSDVTVQRAVMSRVEELNRQLEGKVEQLSEVNRELEAFSYSVSHDLRAPLRHVGGFADKLAAYLGDSADDKARHYLDIIGSSARRMATLIDDLLVYSRLGRGAMRMQAVDMQSMVADTRAVLDANLATEAENGGPKRRVEWHIAPLPMLVADENMMHQVWLNLLGNAIKYSAARDPAVVEVGYSQEPDGSHHFTVRDNGAGFDMAYAGKLFGVFQRLHKASEYPGTGIGLASVRRVLVRHGGRIWAEAEVDRGATFHFILPPALDALNTGQPA